MIHIRTSYSTLLNNGFAQVSKINLYVIKLYRYEIPDEKDRLNRDIESNVESREPLTPFF